MWAPEPPREPPTPQPLPTRMAEPVRESPPLTRQRARVDDGPPTPPQPLVVGDFSDLIGDSPPRSWVDMDNIEHLEQLATKLYDRLHDRLRRDVLVQRERSGFLMDRW